MGARARRGLVVASLAATVLVLSAPPAHACSCGPAPAPAVDFTGIAVQDLGYTPPGAAELGQEHTWLLEVVEPRLGVGPGPVRISMMVGEVRLGDTVASGGCGMDDNLVIGERYEVVGASLERMSACGSLVTGPRAAVPDRSASGAGPGTGVLALAAAGVALLLAGVAVAIARRPR